MGVGEPARDSGVVAAAFDGEVVGAHAGVGGEPVDEEQGEALVRGAVGADVDVCRPSSDAIVPACPLSPTIV